MYKQNTVVKKQKIKFPSKGLLARVGPSGPTSIKGITCKKDLNKYLKASMKRMVTLTKHVMCEESAVFNKEIHDITKIFLKRAYQELCNGS